MKKVNDYVVNKKEDHKDHLDIYCSYSSYVYTGNSNNCSMNFVEHDSSINACDGLLYWRQSNQSAMSLDARYVAQTSLEPVASRPSLRGGLSTLEIK